MVRELTNEVKVTGVYPCVDCGSSI